MTASTAAPIHPEDYLDLVSKIISIYITPHTEITGMEYADLYQTGCLALCEAATSYQPDRNTSFSTYASIVIRSRLYDACRRANRIYSRQLYLDATLTEDGETAFADQLAKTPPSSPKGLIPLLQEIQKEYGGIAAKGIQALLLREAGYSSNDIAEMYHVKPNHISAWVSRASSRLRKDPRILAKAES